MVVVRAAQPADIDAIIDVHIATWKVAYRGQLPDAFLDGLDATRARRAPFWQRAIGDPATSVLVAERDAAIVGFVSVGKPDEAEVPSDTGMLFAIYVHPDAWDAGAGRALMLRAIDELRRLGYAKAFLWVLETNVRARRFYEAGGWRADGATKVEERPGAVLREVRYARTLV